MIASASSPHRFSLVASASAKAVTCLQITGFSGSVAKWAETDSAGLTVCCLEGGATP